VAYLSYKQIARIAAESLEGFGCKSSLPIPVEHIIDNVYKINIIPFPYLFARFEINAFTSSDLRNIYVDEYLYENLTPQYRFTLAHELGHIILHKKIYLNIEMKNLEQWKRFISEVDEIDYRQLEFQANNFAGLFLVPGHLLERTFGQQLSGQLKNIDKSKRQKLKREEYLPWIVEVIASSLGPIFEVDPQVVKI
jgi:hypothetical protein